MFFVYLAMAISIAIALRLAWMLRKARQEIRHETSVKDFWYNKWYKSELEIIQSERRYEALEQGRDEESEAYEQQFLSFQDVLGDQTKVIEELEAIRVDHDVFCLPWLGNDFYPNAEDEDEPIYASVVFDRICG